MMARVFKYVRYFTAAVLFACVAFTFIRDLQIQSTSMFDGPLANSLSFVFAFNKIILAVLLGVILVFDFEIKGTPITKSIIRYLSVFSIGLGLAGFVFLAREHTLMGTAHFMFVLLYLFQTAFVLAAFILYGKARQIEEINDA